MGSNIESPISSCMPSGKLFNLSDPMVPLVLARGKCCIKEAVNLEELSVGCRTCSAAIHCGLLSREFGIPLCVWTRPYISFWQWGGGVASSHFTKEEAEKHRGCMTGGPEHRNGSQTQFKPLHSKHNASHSLNLYFPRPWPTTSELLLRVQALGLGERGILHVTAAFKS